MKYEVRRVRYDDGDAIHVLFLQETFEEPTEYYIEADACIPIDEFGDFVEKVSSVVRAMRWSNPPVMTFDQYESWTAKYR